MDLRHGRAGLLLRPTLAPHLQLGKFPPGARALQDLGVAHGARPVPGSHPVVTGSTTVATEVQGGGGFVCMAKKVSLQASGPKQDRVREDSS